MKDADYDYILDKIESQNNIEFEGNVGANIHEE